MEKLKPNLSDVELAKRIKELKGITGTDEQFNTILKNIISEDKIPNINRIISGLSQEDEFALLCKMMQCCSSITALNQTPLIPNEDEKTPDFQVTFNPSSFLSNLNPHEDYFFQCMVEVKSTEKLRFKTSRADINKRKKYSDRHNLPLLYAVRFLVADQMAYWVLVTAEQLLDKNTLVPNDLVPSLNSVLFDNYTVMINNQYTFIRHYEKGDNVETIGDESVEYGKLVSIEITNNKRIIKLDRKDAALMSLFLNVFDRYGTYIEKFRDKTTIYTQCSIRNIRFLTDIVYSMTRLFTDSKGNSLYDPVRFIASLDSVDNKPVIVYRSVLEDFMIRMNELIPNLFFFGIIGDQQQRSKNIDIIFPELKRKA